MDKKPKLYAVPSGADTKNAKRANEMAEFYEGISIDVLARTLWGEARGEGIDGMKAVACVVLNRVKIAQERGRFWWGNDVIQVCQKPHQFSCWNRTDPNFRKLQEVGEDDVYFASALRIARRAYHEMLEDITDGATHYHAVGILPYWARGKRPCARIARHVFYKMAEG